VGREDEVAEFSSFVANNQTKMVRLAELLIPEERVISDASTAVVEREDRLACAGQAYL